MPIQYMVVRFERKRKVYIDGERHGFTNRTLRVGEGSHTINLGEPKNYAPSRRRPNVTGTTITKPMEVKFEKVEE